MITQKEYELLKHYRATGYRWIARDKDKGLYVYATEPEKRECEWRTNKFNSSGVYNDDGYHLFQYIKWEDEEPTRIDDLIRDYEAHKEIVGERVKVTVAKCVADWIEEVKALERSFKLELLFDTSEMPDEVFDWLDERYGDTNILAKAWLDGFVVEKEKLYTVRLANGSCLYRYVSVGIDWVKGPSDYRDNKDFQLTQAEIESVDPILMKIAKEVEG